MKGWDNSQRGSIHRSNRSEPRINILALRGLRSCGQFAKDYQQSPLMAEDVYFAWTEGFLSGANQAVKSLSRPLRDLSGLPLDAQKAFIRGYCDQHPLAQYCDAVIELYSQFPPLLDKAAR
jgi:hypothetical protein